MSENAEKLQGILGYDPAKRHTLSEGLFKEVLDELKEERVKEAKGKAKEHLTKAVQLRQQMDKAKKDFEVQYKKNEKELGKILNQIQGVLDGGNPTPENEAEEGK